MLPHLTAPCEPVGTAATAHAQMPQMPITTEAARDQAIQSAPSVGWSTATMSVTVPHALQAYVPPAELTAALADEVLTTLDQAQNGQLTLDQKISTLQQALLDAELQQLRTLQAQNAQLAHQIALLQAQQQTPLPPHAPPPAYPMAGMQPHPMGTAPPMTAFAPPPPMIPPPYPIAAQTPLVSTAAPMPITPPPAPSADDDSDTESISWAQQQQALLQTHALLATQQRERFQQEQEQQEAILPPPRRHSHHVRPSSKRARTDSTASSSLPATARNSLIQVAPLGLAAWTQYRDRSASDGDTLPSPQDSPFISPLVDPMSPIAFANGGLGGSGSTRSYSKIFLQNILELDALQQYRADYEAGIYSHAALQQHISWCSNHLDQDDRCELVEVFHKIALEAPSPSVVAAAATTAAAIAAATATPPVGVTSSSPVLMEDTPSRPRRITLSRSASANSVYRRPSCGGDQSTGTTTPGSVFASPPARPMESPSLEAAMQDEFLIPADVVSSKRPSLSGPPSGRQRRSLSTITINTAMSPVLPPLRLCAVDEMLLSPPQPLPDEPDGIARWRLTMVPSPEPILAKKRARDVDNLDDGAGNLLLVPSRSFNEDLSPLPEADSDEEPAASLSARPHTKVNHPRHGVVQVNCAWERLLGYTQEYMLRLSMPDKNFRFMRPDFIAAAHRIMLYSQMVRLTQCTTYIVFLHQTGRPIYCQFSWSVTFDSSGLFRHSVHRLVPLPASHPLPPYVEGRDIDEATILFGQNNIVGREAQLPWKDFLRRAAAQQFAARRPNAQQQPSDSTRADPISASSH